MRNSAYSSFVRQSIIQLVKQSTDTADSSMELDSSRLSFYRQFIHRKAMRSCKISAVQTVNLPFQRTYAQYNIQILTEDTKYEIKKRYSQFQILYNTSLREHKTPVQFPRKTIFQSGCAEEVTAKRIEQLNKLIEQINKQSSSEEVKIKFYQFIQLYEKYEQQGILSNDKRREVAATDQYLVLSICKLNKHSTNSLEVFQLIKSSLAERKRRVSYEVARQLLVGFQQYEGLIPLIINHDNHLILIQGLKLLNVILQPQTNRDYEIFSRVFQKYPPDNLILSSPEWLQNCELKVAYFNLLKHYLDVRHQISIKSIAKFYEQTLQLQKEFLKWQQYFCMTAHN